MDFLLPAFVISILGQVDDAGHMVPMDQPEASLQMIQTWMNLPTPTPTRTGATVNQLS